ncbi:MAG: type II secretion system F family protein [Aliivibrio sp.]|uniref:type II secretion system F family protein n=1 Tax=Aliivibrio sp. TaxID=1872443 RepID=UPI001A5D11DF|nr:type II secretion system F family protein [Aliivibrio sp.]
MTSDLTLFFILLFFSVLFISQALILPAAGSKAKHKALTKRLRNAKHHDDASRSILKEHYLKGLTPLEKKLVKISCFADLKSSIELSGSKMTLDFALSMSLLLSLTSFLVALFFTGNLLISVAVFVMIWFVLYFILSKKISDRLFAFEEQLPEALDIMKRVLQSGQPLNESFREVGYEMADPISTEFHNTFNLLNYGYDLRLAILQMADRNPTVSMLAFSSAVLLQKETGGNLSENLTNVSTVLRSRFKLARKIRTLSAESRMSAWILVLAPFGLFAVMYLIHPEYVEPLYTDPLGIKIVSVGIVSLLIGAVWIKKIINIGV